MSPEKFLTAALIASLAGFAGCKTNLLSGAQASPDNPPPVQQQPAPVVVNGMRTSYADVVERTSPAVVRIEADHKEKVSSQQTPFGDDFFHQFQMPQPNQRPQIERGLGSGVIIDAGG